MAVDVRTQRLSAAPATGRRPLGSPAPVSRAEWWAQVRPQIELA